MVLDTHLPAVTQVTDATWRVELLDGDTVVSFQERAWRIFPAPSLKAPAGLKLALYDPPGMTANALTKLGVPFTALTALKDIPQDSALMIGEDALKQPPEGPWREAVSAFVQKGGKALVLAQVEAVDFLPIPLTQSKHKCTISYVRAADHPVMAGLTDADLKWWAGDHYVSPGNFRKPLTGNWLPLADAGSMEGIIESPLIEEYDSRPNGSQSGGSYILCQYLVGSKALTAPQATTMLQNMLGYLSQPGFFRTPQPTALLAGTSITLRTAMDTSRLVYQDLTGKLRSSRSSRSARRSSMRRRWTRGRPNRCASSHRPAARS